MAKTKIAPNKKGVVSGTKKKDKIVWRNSKEWKKALTVNALAGNDTIDFKKSKYKNKLNGGDGNDIINGGSKDDIIKGGKGNDKLYGNAGNDKLYGEAGNDQIWGGAGNDQIWGGAGNDYIEGGAGNDKLYGDAGNDTIRAGIGNDIVDGGVGNDFIYGNSGTNTLKGGAGADKIWGGTQNDTIFAGVDNDYVDGGSGHDIIYGEAGHDTLLGGAGNDTIYGGIGNDTINAGAGVNTIFFNRNEGTDTVVNGGGNDKIVFAKENNLSALTGTLDGTNLTLSANGTTVKLQNFVAGNHSAKELKAGNMTFNLTKLNGLANGNLIFGTDEAEEINATGNGNDIIIGGNGLDTITFHNFDQDNIVILGNDGIADTIKLADAPDLNVGNSGSINGEVDGNDVILRYNNVAGFRDSIRIKDFLLNDFAYDMTIKAGDGTSKNIKDIVVNDIDNYSAGASVINGTKFKDYITPKNGLKETIYGGLGNDNISANTSLNNYITGDGTGGDSVYGEAGNDHIYYNSRDNVYLDGGEGDDTISITHGVAVGGLGKDEIQRTGYFTDDAVTIYGDLTLEDDPTQSLGGDDTILVSTSRRDEIIYGGGGNDSIVGNGGNDYLHGGAGDDTIYTGSSSGASDSTENIVTHAYGDAGNDIIYGQTIKNIMEGGKGNDSITGWSDGEDIFVYKKGDGADTISGGSYGDTVDTIKFTDETIDISSLTASFDGNNLVINYNQQNGNDKIIITDYMSAGAINSSIDKIELYDGSTYSIKVDVENRIDATEAETTGTVLSDLIIASDEFSNTIHGGFGNDKIVSGTQNDTLYGDAGANIYEFNSGSGTDTVYTTSGQDILKFSVSLQSLSAVINGDDIEITNTYNSDKVILKGYMNNMVDVTIRDNSGFTTTLFEKAGMEVGDGAIGGTAGVDRLIGGAGSDTITGHADNDILNGRGGSDIYVFNKGDGQDTVINGTDSAVDYLKFADSTKEELEYDKNGNDLVIRYNGGSDSVTVKNYFVEGNTVTKLMDSTCASTEDAFDISEVNRHTVTGEPPVVTGTILNDVMTFTSGDDYSLSGGLGNDTITIGAGTNTVDAGKGNDSIVMGTGSATLIFRNGDGHDTINMNLAATDSYLQFMDCEAHQLKYELSGDDMILGYNYDSGTKTYKDSVTIKDWATYYDPSTDTIPVLNIIKDSSGYSGSQDNILYRFQNRIDNSVNQEEIINGTKFIDNIIPHNGLKEVIYGGYGDDSISQNSSSNNYITGDGEGADTVYGGAGNDFIWYNSRDNVYLDGGAGDDEIRMTQGIAIGGLGEDLIRRDGFWSDDVVTIYGDLTLEEDAEQTQGGADSIYMLTSGKNEIVYGGGGNDTIKGRGGDDILYGGAGDDWIWSNSGYAVDNVQKDPTAGWVSEIHGGAGADYLFAQVETNTLYGDEGNDNFYAYSDQHTTIYDSEGTDTLNMFDTNSGDASKDALNVIFNVSKTYTYDPEDPATLFDGDVMLLNEDNLALYCVGEAYAGVTIKGNAVERINDSANHYMTNADISALANSVAGWLTTANGGAGYDNVTLALASEEKDALLTFIATNTNWS